MMCKSGFALAVLVGWLIAGSAFAEGLYLSTYDGDGSDEAPFRAMGVGQGAECTSLRDDETKKKGLALCMALTVPNSPEVIDLTGRPPVTDSMRSKIEAKGGKHVSATTFDELMAELTTGKSLVKYKDGKNKLMLKGQEVWSKPAPVASDLSGLLRALHALLRLPAVIVHSLISVTPAYAAATVTETWTCADDPTTPFTCDLTWSLYQGAVAGVVSNTFRTVNSISSQFAYATTGVDSTDMEVSVQVVSIDRGTANDVSGGAAARHPGTGTSTYVYCVLRDAATDQVEYGHAVSGSTTVDGTTNRTVTNGDTIAVRAVDDQLSCYHNSTLVLGPITENTGNGNVKGMVRMAGSGTGTTTLVVLDNWQMTNSIGGGGGEESLAVMRRRGL